MAKKSKVKRHILMICETYVNGYGVDAYEQKNGNIMLRLVKMGHDTPVVKFVSRQEYEKLREVTVSEYVTVCKAVDYMRDIEPDHECEQNAYWDDKE